MDYIDWDTKAEDTPEVFGRPTISPQGQDGVPHLNYFDSERLLSFQWDGHLEQHVVVSHGGYGEPIRWTFDFMSAWAWPVRNCDAANKEQPRVLKNEDLFWGTAYHFKRACDAWIQMQEMEK